MHGNGILSPDPKFISSVIKQSEYFDEEILEKVNNKFCTPTEFNNGFNELSTKKTKPLHVPGPILKARVQFFRKKDKKMLKKGKIVENLGKNIQNLNKL